MYRILYKTTNKINGKYYIGVHKTNNINDNYLGSGDILQKAINKYGKDNFERIILWKCNNDNELYDLESKFVKKRQVNDKNCYNVKSGGFGGFDYINSKYDTIHNLASTRKSRNWANNIIKEISIRS